MKYTHYHTILMLFSFHVTLTMELALLTKPQQCYTFITNEIPAQHITIPLELAMQCKSIKTMLKDLGPTALQESPLEVPIDASTEIVLEFIAYLKKIDRRGKITDNQLSELKIQNFILAQHLKTFDTTELIDLALIVDQYDITDNYHLIKELTSRMHPPIKECFNRLNYTALLRSVMQKACKDDQYDTIIIQPYANALNTCCSVPRTESLIQNFNNNIYNAFRWHSQILFMPYYINFQTSTIIKTEEYLDYSNAVTKTSSLRIFKQNNSPIIIQFKHIQNITHIEANTDESLFICKCKDFSHPCEQYYIIDPTNPDKEPPCYDICTFTENNEELYAAKDGHFGIFNAKTNTFSPINVGNNCRINHISTNKNKTTIAIVANIPMVANKTTIAIFIGKKNNQNGLTFQQFNIKNFKNIDEDHWKTGITNICLHPRENKIYLETMGACYIIDLDTLCGILLNAAIPSMMRDAHEIQFISDDILFLGYETGKDYFLNIRTGNHWTKDKPSGSRRLALTTDCMHSIEKVTKPIDGKITITTEIRQIINDPIINTVRCLNQGYNSLALLTIVQQKQGIITLDDNDTKEYQHLNENLKTVFNATHTIANTTLLSQAMAPFRSIWPTVSYYGKAGAVFTATMIVVTLFNLLIKRVSKNKLDDNDVSILREGILWLAQLALG